MKKSKPLEDHWTRLEKSLVLEKPKDAFTVNEVSERCKVSPVTAWRFIDKSIKAGVMEKGGSGNAVWYRFTK